MEMFSDLLGVNRFPHRRKACQLALASVLPKAESLRRGPIGMTETIDRRRCGEALVAAVDRLDFAVSKMTVAVIHCVAAAIGGHEQRIVPFGVEESRQRVRQMVVIEMD